MRILSYLFLSSPYEELLFPPSLPEAKQRSKSADPKRKDSISHSSAFDFYCLSFHFVQLCYMQPTDSHGQLLKHRQTPGESRVHIILPSGSAGLYRVPGHPGPDMSPIFVVKAGATLSEGRLRVQGSAKRWALGCVNSPSPHGQRIQEAGITQPRAHLLADPCTNVDLFSIVCRRATRESLNSAAWSTM